MLDLISIGGIKPDLLLLFFLFFTVRKGAYIPIIFGFGLGLIQDLVGGGFIGLYALSKSVTGFVIGKLFPEKTPEEIWLHIGGIILCILVHDTISSYIYHQDGAVNFFSIFWKQVLPSSLYNLLIFVILKLLPFKRNKWADDGMAR
jgi:rod shape-determining protein MreD